MLSKLRNRQKGFTLIEIVIVLAIAALIILVVLQAVAGAQRSQRDNARKQAGGSAVSYLEEFFSNNNGTYPLTIAGATGANTAINTTYGANTPLANYTVSATSPTTYVAPGGTYAVGAACGTQTSTTHVLVYTPNSTTAPATDYDLAVCLEAGGADTVHL